MRDNGDSLDCFKGEKGTQERRVIGKKIEFVGISRIVPW
jgi:hypothetical protein